MFLRRYERHQRGKKHTYWALVESIRTAQGSRQRVVAYLGELKKSERNGWAWLGRRLDKKERPAPSLFDPPAYPEPDDRKPVLVKIRGIRLERSRDFGDVWLALGLWRLVGLDELLTRRMPTGREEVPWPVVASILSIARFCEPSSELHIGNRKRGTENEQKTGQVRFMHSIRPSTHHPLPWVGVPANETYSPEQKTGLRQATCERRMRMR